MPPSLTDLRKNFDIILVIVAALLAYMLFRRYSPVKLRASL